MGRLITETGTSLAIVAANNSEITYFPFNVGAASITIDSRLDAVTITTGTLSANSIVGRWEGLPLESYQVNVEGIDIKATGVPPNRYFKTNEQGVVAWVEEAPVDVNNITGDLTVHGNISATGNLSANDIDVTNAILSGGTNINDLFGPGGTLSGIGGGGSANTVAKFSDSTTIADSNISDDGSTVTIAADITSGNLLNITNDEVSKFSVSADGSTTIQGNLSVHGDMHYIDTLVTVTSALSIINSGTGPGLTVEQKGTDEPIAHFIDKEGGEIMFDDAGQVGIGIKNPDQKLTVAGGISASEGLTAANIYSDGRVGINTNTPDYMLDVAGSVGIGACLIHNGDDDTFIHFTDDDINIQAGGVNFIDITQDTTNEITFNEAGADVDFRAEGDSDTHLLFVDAGTNKVGIGTDAPDYKLDVAGNIGMNEYLYHNGDGDTYLRFAPNTVNLVAGGKSALKYEASTGKILINNTNQDVDFQVMADGGNVLLHTDAGTERVGINTTSPGEALTVAGGISAGEGLSAKNIDSAYSILSAGTDLIDIFAQASGGSYIDGSGTANTIAKFSDSNTIANSNITDDGSTVKVSAPLSGDDYIKGQEFCLGANSRVDNPATNNLGLYANNELGLELVSDTRVCSHHDLTVNGTISASSNLSAGGRFFAPNGSAAAPTFSFSDFPGTGLLMADTDTLGFATRGSVRMAVDESGCVGIGTTSPTANFEVNDGGIYAGNGATKGYGFHDFGTGWGYKGVTGPSRLGIFTDTVERITVASNGKVGIGVTNPGVTLTVQGGISASGGLSAGNLDLVGGSGTTNFIPKFTDPDTLGDSIAYIGSDNINIEGGLSALQGLSADNNIYGGGCVNHFVNNVGINIANPSEKLTIQGALSSSNKGVFDRIGIGVSSPNADLHVSNSGAPTFRLSRTGTGQIWQQSIDSSGRFLLLEAASEGGTQYTRFGIDDAGDTCLVPVAGNVGVGTTSPEAKLTVQGNISADGTLSASGDIDVDGDLYLDGNIYLDEDQRIFFEEDQATWIETDSADRLRFVAGGKQMLLLDQDTGDRAVFGFGTKVGINIGNNTTPASYLTVAGDISASEGLSAGKTSYFADKVGIGTSSPGAPFHVKSTTSNAKMRLTNDNSTNWDFAVGNTGYYQGNLFISNPAIANEQFTLGSTGNVGINVFNPTEKLTVGGNISACGRLCVEDIYTNKIYDCSSPGSYYLDPGSISRINVLCMAGYACMSDIRPNTTLTVTGGISAQNGLSANNLNSASSIISAGTDLIDIFGPGGSLSGVDGGGDACYLPAWSDSNTIENSIACQSANLLTVQGTVSASGVKVPDNSCINIGTVNELKLYHDGTDSYVDNGCGDLILRTAGSGDDVFVRAVDDVFIQPGNGDPGVTARGGGAVELYYNGGNKKLETTNTGVTVTGNVSASEGLSAGKTSYFAGNVGIGTAAPNKNLTVAGDISATGCYYVPDTGQIRVGDGGDLVIQHDGNYSYITEQGQNDLYIQPNNSSLYVRDAISGNVMIAAKSGSGKIVELYAGGSKKLATNSSGVTVTGDATINGSVSASDGLSANNLDSAFNILSAGTDLTDIFGPGGSAGNINGSGTACYLPVWSDADTIGNSIALQTSTVLSVAGSISAQGYCSTETNTIFGTQALNATSGGQNTAIGLQAMLANTSGYQNVAVGEAALQCNTEGLRNTAVGCGALLSNTTGDCSVAVGCQAGFSNQTGNSQVAIGSRALYNSTVGENVAVGSCALEANTTGIQNTAVGHRALDSNTIGKCNVGIGFNTLYKNVTACGNVAVGNYALYNNSCGEKNTAVGNCALWNNTEGWYNVAVGHSTLCSNTTGEYNVAIGRQALNASTTADYNVGIGRQALWCNTTGCHNIALGQSSLYCNETGCYNVAIGGCAMNCNIGGYFNVALGCGTMYHANSGYHNNAIGYLALYCNFGGHGNNAFGRDALGCTTTGNCNDAMGYRALYKNTTGSNNVAIGAFAMSEGESGDYNVAVGKYAANQNESTRNTAIGYYALYNNTAADNVAVGYSAASSNTSGYYNVAVGRGALTDNQTGANNTAIGHCALHENEANNNTGVGIFALLCNTTGTTNTAIGNYALQNSTTEDGNTAVGYAAGYANTTGSCNTAVGRWALCSNTTGCRNVALGADAMCLNTTGDFNTSIGYQSMFDNISGYQNVALGYAALGDNTKGHNNVAIGESALRKNIEAGANTAVGKSAAACNTTGACNAALGYQALNRNTTGDKNTSLGACALFSNTVGSNNIGVGYHSLLQATTATQNIAVGSGAMYSNCHGCANVAIGHQALYSNKCSYNVAIGDLALNAQTTGYYNTAVGALASRCMTTGTVNTAVGMYAMHNNTTASRNTALGYGALFSNDEGGDNTAVGSNALCKTTANANTAVGSSALICTTTGGCNVAMGNSALLKNCAGSFNIGIGSLAMCANSSGCYNTAMGYSAARLHTTGCSNVSIGYQTLYSNTIGCENTAIGMHSLYNSVESSGNIAVGHLAGKVLVDGSTALTAPGNSTYLGTCTRGKAVDDDNVTVIGFCACACGDNTVSIGNANVTDTYINGCTSVVGDISASGNGYFTCVIAGGYFEEKAAHPSLAKHPTGSLVVIGQDGNLTLSTRKNDKRVFGVTQKGACQPIILGAEPVLVTGNIKAGDFITTSDKLGHGMKSPDPIYGSVIAQSMEDGTGDSHLVQAMIRKL